MSFRKPVRREGPFSWINTKKGKLIFLTAFTLTHMALTATFFYWSYSAVMSTTDSSNPFSNFSRTLVQISDVFTWPIIFSLIKDATLRNTLPDYTVYLALIMNSLLWAVVIFGIMLIINRFGRGKRRTNKQ